MFPHALTALPCSKSSREFKVSYHLRPFFSRKMENIHILRMDWEKKKRSHTQGLINTAGKLSTLISQGSAPQEINSKGRLGQTPGSVALLRAAAQAKRAPHYFDKEEMIIYKKFSWTQSKQAELSRVPKQLHFRYYSRYAKIKQFLLHLSFTIDATQLHPLYEIFATSEVLAPSSSSRCATKGLSR